MSASGAAKRSAASPGAASQVGDVAQQFGRWRLDWTPAKSSPRASIHGRMERSCPRASAAFPGCVIFRAQHANAIDCLSGAKIHVKSNSCNERRASIFAHYNTLRHTATFSDFRILNSSSSIRSSAFASLAPTVTREDVYTSPPFADSITARKAWRPASDFLSQRGRSSWSQSHWRSQLSCSPSYLVRVSALVAHETLLPSSQWLR